MTRPIPTADEKETSLEIAKLWNLDSNPAFVNTIAMALARARAGVAYKISSAVAPLPWSVDEESINTHWKDSISITDSEGGTVCVLTRGYEGDENGEGCPSYSNAKLIVDAVSKIAIEDISKTDEINL